MHCIVMPTPVECLCCREISQVVNKLSQQTTALTATCITEHIGFTTVCLDVWVLHTAYFQYHQQYGTYNAPINELSCYLYTLMYLYLL